MANFQGYTPHVIERFTSLVEQDDPVNLPTGAAAECRNGQFLLTRVRTRDGINKTIGNAAVGMDPLTGFPITGLYSFKYNGNGVVADKQVPLIFDGNGSLFIESPAGSGHLSPVTSSQVTPPAGAYLQADQTLNRAYLVFNNIANPSAAAAVNAVYDLNTGILDPLSGRPVGQTWAAGVKYRVGECVTPVLASAGGNGLAPGKMFRCTVAGTSGNAEPTWPSTDAGTVADGGVTWTENTPLFSTVVPTVSGIKQAGTNTLTSALNIPNSGMVVTCTVNAGAGTFAAARDVYIAVSLVNGNGETDTLSALAIQNTTLNDQLSVRVTTALRTWLTSLAAPAAPTGWNLYVADVATGAAAPALSAYGKVAGGPFSVALNTTVTVGVSPVASGTAANTVSADIGDIDQGILPTISVGGILRIGNITYLRTASGFVAATNVNASGSVASGVPLSNAAFLVSGLGNVDAGNRWAIVLYQNRNGYIFGWSQPAAVESTLVGGNLQIQMVNIPIGPAETAARIVAFTVAGGLQAGPYAYVPSNDTSEGIRMTSTVINDNSTTTGTFNFTDTYLTFLISSTANVSLFFDKVQIPACRSVSYSKTLNRVIYFPYNTPSGVYITPQRDPETVFGSTGILQVAETDGTRIMGWADLRGVQLALKESSGWEVLPSADSQSQWLAVNKWDGVGPCGLRAWDVGKNFVAFAHREGAYIYKGGAPERISKELTLTWARINWAAAETIWVQIDDETHEIRFGVPLDQATVPSHVLRVNYEEDLNLGPPIHATMYSRGKFISSATARKWTIDDIGANSCIRAYRTITNAPVNFDSRTKQSQILYASSFDSSINAVTPGIFSDNGVCIPFVYETACPGDALKEARLGGVQMMATGNGAIDVIVLAGAAKSSSEGGVNNRRTEIKMKPMVLRPGVSTDYACMASGRNERFRVRVAHVGKTPGTWVDVKQCTIWTNPLFEARAN